MSNKISYISLLISIASLVLVGARIKPIQWDWLGILVGVLALLTTILIGWQIYNVVNFDNERKRMKEEVNQIQQRLVDTANHLKQEHNDALYSIMGEMALMYNNEANIRDFKFVNYMLSSAMYGLRNDRDITNHIKGILEYGEMGLKMKKHHKTLVLDTFYKGVKPLCMDENISTLEYLLINIEEYR